ncbi:MAG: hypothetical protein H6841_08575 [Planctomycetes bacterium]|nr:hypothetical protein [Planctomycetota bacterium]MCB9934814.1 hypothetical protein [Planctomycetota bacterium]
MRVLRLLPLVLLFAACGSAEVKNVQSQADLFMERLSRGDFNGAFELCDADAVSKDALQSIGNNPAYDPVLNDFQGLVHQEGAQATRNDANEIIELRLPPTRFRGHDGWLAHFKFRKENGAWLIIGFKLEGPSS